MIVLSQAVYPAAAQESAQRPWRLNDYFEEEFIPSDAVAFSPDGESVVFERTRAASTQLHTGLSGGRAVRSDIWLQEAPGRTPRNLTNGRSDSSGWWNPSWSPDGQRLLFLSSRGGNVTPWVWERSSRRVRELSTRGIAFQETAKACGWLDAGQVLCIAMPDGGRSTPLSIVGRGVERAEAAWSKARAGETSVSSVHSLEFRFPERRLLVIDVATGHHQEIGSTPSTDYGPLPWWSVSPDGEAIALVKQMPFHFNWVNLRRLGVPASIELRTPSGSPIALNRPLPANVVTTTLKWSPDGAFLAFFALEDRHVHPEVLYGEGAYEIRYPAVASKEYAGRLWRVDLVRGLVEPWSTGDIDLGQRTQPPEFHWTAGNALLFYAPRLVNGSRPLVPADAVETLAGPTDWGNTGMPAVAPSVNPQWILLQRNGRTQQVTAGADNAPATLHSVDGGKMFVGLAGGELWRIDPVRAAIVNLTESVGDPILRFSVGEDSMQRPHIIVVAGAAKSKLDRHNAEYFGRFGSFHAIDPISGKMSPLDISQLGATRITDYDPTTGRFLYTVDNSDGTSLWRAGPRGGTEELAAVNGFRKYITPFQQRIIEYTSTEGHALKAKVVFPGDYQPGRRYPVVINSDIGYTHENTPHAYTIGSEGESDERNPWGAAPFASAGYVYVFASMPTVTGMDEIGRANLLLLTSGLLPAVDKLIGLGIADPERVFLYGGSSMGYGVAAVVTQTARFAAAVSEVGWVDMITNGLSTIRPELRYTEYPTFYTLSDNNAVPYLNSRLPVWRNGDLYRRNSPLAYVDRVQTPLLMVAPDMDAANMRGGQYEMFFQALSQQRKPAELVRYWGEGHGIQSPANHRDRLQRIFAWFDRYGDIARDERGNILYEDGRPKSRKGAPPLEPAAYAVLGLFGQRDGHEVPE